MYKGYTKPIHTTKKRNRNHSVRNIRSVTAQKLKSSTESTKYNLCTSNAENVEE